MQGKGKYTYDNENDIVMFKIKNKEYSHSNEYEEIIVDLDKNRLVSGIRIFDASEILTIKKEYLEECKEIRFNIKIKNDIIELDVKIRTIDKNNQIVHYSKKICKKMDSNYLNNHEEPEIIENNLKI